MKLSRILGVVCLPFFILFFSISSWSAAPPTVTIFVDATSAPRKIFHGKLKIPATAGDLTLYYPKWIPGEHAPDGPVIDLAGLKFNAAGKILKWRRDLLDGYTLHVEVPAGVNEIEAELDFLSPATFEGGFSAGSSATDKMAVISWNQVLLYPKGFKSDDINYTASLKLPEGWKFGTPLPIANQSGDEIHFSTVSLTTLVDSPVITGQFLKVVRLADDPLAEMDIAADSAAALDAPKEVWDHYKNLVEQANKLFGAHHYRDYHFLLSSAITSPTSAWSITSPMTAALTSAAWSMKLPASWKPPCFLTNMCIRGTENTGVPLISPRPTINSPCRTICFGCTRV